MMPRTALRLLALALLKTLATGASCQTPEPLVLSACDSTDDWTGGTLVADPVKEGSGAILWDHGKSDRLVLRTVPGDWKPYNTLSFWMYSPKATGSRFMLIIASENPKTDGADYYSAAIIVDFTGWRQYTLSFLDDLGENRTPMGWSQVGGLNFTASGWDNTPNPETRVVIDDLRLTWEAARLGPRMTDEQLFAALNLDYPGLEETKRLVEAGDLGGAKAAFVAHLKTRERPRFYVNPADIPAPDERPAKPDTRGADAALEQRYTVMGVTLQFEDEIDWRANPTDPFSPEWTWQFGRFHWWSSLGRAYWDTGDEKYVRQFVKELRSWVHVNLMPGKSDNSVGSRWRTIECGIRLAGSWPNAFFRFLPAESFTVDDIILMVKSFAEQADYLHRYPTGGNWLTMEANGMGHVGVLFPEFKRAETWRTDAVARLYRELDTQVYPDGPQKELTTGYHYVALGNFLGLVRICMFNDVPVPEDYIAKLERMWEMGMWAMTPDRTLPHVNDAWFVNVPGELKRALEYFPGREDFRWIATDGKEGVPPDHTSHWFPWSGWAVMRSGWDRDDSYLFFDVGPFGMGHQHEDKLAFVVHAYGSDLLVDVGSYAYDRSAMRAYVLSPQAHNTVLVDGGGQHRRARRNTFINSEPQDNPWHSTDALDFISGEYADGFGTSNDETVTHRRAILFVKPDYWLVLDTLVPSDAETHRYEALFHFGPENAEAAAARAWTVGDRANLQLLAAGAQVTAQIVKGQEKPYYLGWIGKHGLDGRRPMPVARFTWDAAGESRVLYAVYPTPPGEESPVESFKQVPADAGLSAELRFRDGRRDVVSIEGDKWRVERHSPTGEVVSVLTVEP